MRRLRAAAFLLFAGTLSACGGGGMEPAPPVPPAPPAPAGLSYPVSQPFTVGTAITALMPTVSGSPTQYSVSPSLPPGLALDTTTGVISGTPTVASPPANYQVTASNVAGSVSIGISIAVENPPLPDNVLLRLGHAHAITQLLYEGSRILSLDSSGHAALWDAQTGELLAEMDSDCLASACHGLVAMAGPTVIVRKDDGFEVFDSANGARIVHIAQPGPTHYWWKLSPDGNYLAAATANAISLWARSGTGLFNHAGDYRQAEVFAANGELRIARGPAGDSIIETVTLPVGAATLSPAFQGAFHSWFSDGERFLTTVADTVRVYSKTGTQQDIATLPATAELGGRGNWMWTADATTLRLHAVGASASPAATFSRAPSDIVAPSANTLALLPADAAQLSVIDLSTAVPTRTDYPSSVSGSVAYAATSGTARVFGTNQGAVFMTLANAQGPVRLALGRARSISSRGLRLAVATAAGEVAYYFDAPSRGLQRVLSVPSVQVELSADGSRLATASSSAIRVYDMPNGDLLAEWAFVTADSRAFDMSFAGSGAVIGQIFGGTAPGSTWTRQVLRLDGTPLWSDSRPENLNRPGALSIHLSPNGNLIAVSDNFDSSGAPGIATVTRIYTAGALTTSFDGLAVGWIDDSRLILNRYEQSAGATRYARCEIATAAGQVSPCPPLPELLRIQALTASTIYSPERNRIFDLTSGAEVWTHAAPALGQGAVTNNSVVFASGARVLVERR